MTCDRIFVAVVLSGSLFAIAVGCEETCGEGKEPLEPICPEIEEIVNQFLVDCYSESEDQWGTDESLEAKFLEKRIDCETACNGGPPQGCVEEGMLSAENLVANLEAVDCSGQYAYTETVQYLSGYDDWCGSPM